MGNATMDIPALLVAMGVATAITAVLAWALRDGDSRRGWIAAGALTGVLLVIGVGDLVRHSPRETPFTLLLLGVVPPVLGALGVLRGTRRLRPWLRLPLVYATALLLLFGGFLLGAVVSRWLPF